jgi:hypothetical protein
MMGLMSLRSIPGWWFSVRGVLKCPGKLVQTCRVAIQRRGWLEISKFKIQILMKTALAGIGGYFRFVRVGAF